MFSPDTVRLYQRFLALGILCACFVVVGSPTLTETAFSAGCIEQCMDTEAMCYDNCADECSSSDSACGGCVETCANQFNSCTWGKVICSGYGGGGTTYSPSCEVHFGTHNAGSPDQHYGYFEVCASQVGNERCMKCPPGESCSGNGYNDVNNSCF